MTFKLLTLWNKYSNDSDNYNIKFFTEIIKDYRGCPTKIFQEMKDPRDFFAYIFTCYLLHEETNTNEEFFDFLNTIKETI